MKTFFKGALLLIVASFLGECFDFMINMVLTRELGEEGIGHYMSIMPIMFFIIVLASFELPISISKYVAETEKPYHWPMLKYAFRLTLWISICFSLIVFLLFPALPPLKSYHPSVTVLFVLLVPMISFSSIARGYLMGTQQMGKIAFANGFRKLVQLILLILLFNLFEFSPEMSVIAGLSSFIASEAVIVLYLLTVYVYQAQELKKSTLASSKTALIRRSLFRVSVPTTILRIFHSMTHAIQPFLIKYALMAAGVSEVGATEQFGLLSGVAMTIGFFPAFIAHALLTILIPTVSEAFAKGNQELLKKLLQQSLGMTMLYGIPAIVIMFAFAEPLTSLFVNGTTATLFLKLLWPYFFTHFLIIPLQAYLIGLNLIKDAVFHTVWAHFISFVVIFLLGSQPEWQMSGVIIGLNAGGLLQLLMHYMTICQKIGIGYWSLKEKRVH